MGRESLALVVTPPAAAGPTTVPPKAAATALAPGFRFHPTDEELVSYYLKRKVLNKPVRFNAIEEVDIYKHEPWELAVYSRLKTRDQEWYFFSALDKKYGNGARMNRATSQGYWKATGKDREIRRDIQPIGMKKTLVFHSGRAPDGLRTNWVMHEYRLVDYEMDKTSGIQDAYVLCRVFHKNNIGPPSGNRYAPFLEEEWDQGEMALVPGEDIREPLAVAKYANGGNKIEQEIQSHSKAFININELPRESQTGQELTRETVNRHQHREEQLLEPEVNNNNGPDASFKREHPDEQDCPSLCVLNKEAPLPLLQYKRRRQNDSNHSSRTTQDHCSSTTTADTMLTSSAATTAISALLEFSLLGSIDTKEKLRPVQKEGSPMNSNRYHYNHIETSMPSSCSKLINDLEKEIHQMAVERETFKLEMMSAEAMISILQSRIDALRQENEELRSVKVGL